MSGEAPHLRVVEAGEELPACDLLAEKIVACNCVENLVGAEAPRVLEVCEIVQPDDFWDLSYRAMYRAALAVHARGEAVTPNAVLAVLEAVHELRGDARANYFEALKTAPEERNIAARALTIRELARRRSSSQLAGEVSIRLRARSEAPTEEIITETVSKLEALAADMRPVPVATMATLGQAALARLTQEAPRRISTGVPGIDEIQKGGVAIGQTTWLGARRGTGKSALVGFIAEAAARAGWPTVVVSLENEPLDFLSRMACSRAGLALDLLDDPAGASGDTIGRYSEALAAITALPLMIVGGPSSTIGSTVPSIRQELRRATATMGRPRLLVVDYVQRMRVDHSSRTHSSEQLSEHGWGLMQLANTCAIAVLGVVQLNEENKIKDCRKLEDHGQSVWHLRRLPKGKSAWATALGADDDIELQELWVEKARFAKQHVATPLEFDKRRMRFSDAWRVGE